MKRPQAAPRLRYEGWSSGRRHPQAIRRKYRAFSWWLLDPTAKLVVGLAIIYLSLVLILR